MTTLVEGYKTRYSATRDKELSPEQHLALCKTDPCAPRKRLETKRPRLEVRCGPAGFGWNTAVGFQ